MLKPLDEHNARIISGLIVHIDATDSLIEYAHAQLHHVNEMLWRADAKDIANVAKLQGEIHALRHIIDMPRDYQKYKEARKGQ